MRRCYRWQEIGVLRLTQTRDQFILLGDLRTPVCHPRLRGDPGKPGCGVGVVHRFCGPDKGLRRDAADIDARPSDRAVADQRNLRPVRPP